MAESHVVSALVDKKSEISGQIIALREEIERFEIELKHIDATIKIFSPEYDLRTVKVKKIYKKNDYFKSGELTRLVMDTLRKSNSPMTVRELTETVLNIKLIENNIDNFRTIQKNVISTLKYKDGTLVKKDGEALDGSVKWVLI